MLGSNYKPASYTKYYPRPLEKSTHLPHPLTKIASQEYVVRALSRKTYEETIIRGCLTSSLDVRP